MDKVVITIITALFSGIIGSVITLLWQKHSENMSQKKRLFATLMSMRYEISAEENVRVLNMIDAVFYRSKTVREAYQKFYKATNEPNSPNRDQHIMDAYLRLLEEIANDVKYKKINWQEIKGYYYPIGLADRKQQEKSIRTGISNITAMMTNGAPNAAVSINQQQAEEKR